MPVVQLLVIRIKLVWRFGRRFIKINYLFAKENNTVAVIQKCHESFLYLLIISWCLRKKNVFRGFKIKRTNI